MYLKSNAFNLATTNRKKIEKRKHLRDNFKVNNEEHTS